MHNLFFISIITSSDFNCFVSFKLRLPLEVYEVKDGYQIGGHSSNHYIYKPPYLEAETISDLRKVHKSYVTIALQQWHTQLQSVVMLHNFIFFFGLLEW